MVAMSIQSFASGPDGAPSPADRIMASSQGVFMQAIDASGITPKKQDSVDRLLLGGHSQEVPTVVLLPSVGCSFFDHSCNLLRPGDVDRVAGA